jgi:hypothetical protein
MSCVYGMDEELIVRNLECHYCNSRISVITVPDFIAFCDNDCAESWKKGFQYIEIFQE